MERREAGRPKHLSESFRYAISGFVAAVREERNLRIQLAAGIAVVVLSLFLQVSLTHLLIIFVLIGGVISLELVNTALERFVDMIVKDRHPIAGAVKDIAAAAVWWFSMIAAVIYLLILLDAWLQ